MHVEDEHSTGLSDSLKENPGITPDIIQDYPPEIASEKVQSRPEPLQRKDPVDENMTDTTLNSIGTPSRGKSESRDNDVQPDDISSPNHPRD
jgi:hypothetical protein